MFVSQGFFLYMPSSWSSISGPSWLSNLSMALAMVLFYRRVSESDYSGVGMYSRNTSLAIRSFCKVRKYRHVVAHQTSMELIVIVEMCNFVPASRVKT